jgi:8-oxo-dGTP pyrophosphatase MutT (NUDIX family)
MPWNENFIVNHQSRIVDLAITDSTPEAINKAFQDTIDAAITSDNFSALHGDHSEPYLVQGVFYPLHIERFTAPIFGIATRGAHMTGYTRSSSGELKIWVGRRSAHLFTYPGKLDTTVAGGVKAQHTPHQCIIEESEEEASLPKDFVSKHVRSVGVITYMTRNQRTGATRPDVLFVFDLEMPESLIPTPNDEEVSEFKLLSIEEVKAAMFGGEFKANCNLVMIDFFIRHGILTPENEPDYIELQQRLHRRLPIPTSPNMR